MTGNTFWTTNSAGTTATVAWGNVAAGNKIAVFAAGGTATGAYTVTTTANITALAGVTFEDGNVTIGGTGGLTLAQNATINTVAATGNQTISTAIGGSFGLTKTGNGTLILSGTNTFTGTTTISQGTLQLNANAASGASGTLGNATSSVLLGDGSANTTALLAGANNVAINRNITVSTGGTSTIGGASSLVSGAASFGGNIALNKAVFLESDGTTNVTFSGIISGTGNVTKIGTGTVTLNNASNSYVGNTIVGSAGAANAGTVVVGTANALGNGSLVIFGGNVTLNGTDTVSGLSLGGGAVGSTATLGGGSTLTLNGNVSYDGSTGANGATISAALSLGSADRTFNVTSSANATNDLTVSSGITGSGGLIKTGNGTLLLSGSSSYSGNTTIAAGTISASNLASGGNLGNNGAIILGDGTNQGTLSYTGATSNTSRTIATSAGGGEFDVTNAASTYSINSNIATTGNLTFGGAGNVTLNGIITGTGAVVINGTGRVTYNSNNNAGNSYSGDTFINSGTLLLSGAKKNNATGAGNITIGDGTHSATLLYDTASQLSNSVTIFMNANGTLNLASNDDTFGSLVDGSNTSTGFGNVILGSAKMGIGADNANATFSGVIAGTGTVTKSGTGTQVFAGANSYSGTTTIGNGTLQIGSGGTSGSVGTGGLTVANTGNFTINRSDSFTFSNVITGGGNITQAGAGTTTFSANNSSFTGNIYVTQGGLVGGATTSLGSSAVSIVVSPGASLGLAAGGSYTFGNLTISGAGSNAAGALNNVSGNNTVVSTTTFVGNTTISNAITNTNLTLGNVFLGNTGVTVNTLSLNPTANATITVNGAISDYFSPAGTYINVAHTGNGTVILGNSTNTYGGDTILGSAGGATSGTLKLTADNAIPGRNIVNGQTAGQPSSVVYVYSGTLDLNNHNAEAYGQNTSFGSLGATQVGLYLGGGAAGTTATITTGTGALTLDKNLVYDGSTGANGALIQGNLQLYGITGNSTNVHVFTVTDGASANDLTISAAISESGGINSIDKTGAGRLLVSGSNSYTGGTDIHGGYLSAQNNNAFGTGYVSASAGATLELSNAANGNLTISNSLTLAGTGATGSNGALENVAGTNAWTGSIKLNNSAVSIKADANTQLTLSNSTITSTTASLFPSLELGGAGNIIVADTIGSTTANLNIRDLSKTGNGTVTLSNINYFVGNVSVAGGTLNIQNAGALSGSTVVAPVTVADGATLAFTNMGATTGNNSLTFSGTGYNGAGAIHNVSGTNVFGQTGSTVSIGAAAGGTTTIIADTGSQLTFSGNVSSSAGSGQTLQVDSAGHNGSVTFSRTLALGSTTGTAVNLATYGTGTISVNGTVGNSTIGSVSVNGGSTLAFGGSTTTSTGTQTINSSTMTVGSNAYMSTGAVHVESGTYSLGNATVLTTNGAAFYGNASSSITVAPGGNVSMGALTMNSSTLTVGGNASWPTKLSTGNVQQSGGSIALNAGTTATTGSVNIAGAGTLSVAANSTVTTSGSVTMGNATNSAISVSGSVTTNGNFYAGTSTSLSIASGGMVTVNGNATFNSGTLAGAGTLQVNGNNSLTFNGTISAPNMTLILNGGSVGTNAAPLTVFLGGSNVSLGTIIITGDTILDFGNSAGTVLSSVNLDIQNGAKVQVNNWSTTNFNTTLSTIWYATGNVNNQPRNNTNNDYPNTNSDLGQITFNNPQGSNGNVVTWVEDTSSGWFDQEIRPTPEPSTYGAIFVSGCLGVLGLRRYRRNKSQLAKG